MTRGLAIMSTSSVLPVDVITRVYLWHPGHLLTVMITETGLGSFSGELSILVDGVLIIGMVWFLLK